jgi:hypothetical protein
MAPLLKMRIQPYQPFQQFSASIRVERERYINLSNIYEIDWPMFEHHPPNVPSTDVLAHELTPLQQ